MEVMRDPIVEWEGEIFAHSPLVKEVVKIHVPSAWHNLRRTRVCTIVSTFQPVHFPVLIHPYHTVLRAVLYGTLYGTAHVQYRLPYRTVLARYGIWYGIILWLKTY